MTRKLDKEHLDAINALQEQFNENSLHFGTVCMEIEYIETQKKSLEQRKSELFSQFLTFKDNETKLVETLESRYGIGHINIQEGTFTPSEPGQVNQ